MSTLINDIKYGLRMLAKSPGFTIGVVLVLALGIGANTAVFSVINAVLLSTLPYEQPGRLVQVFQTMRNGDEGVLDLSLPTYRDMRKRNHTFVDMAAFQRDTATLTGNGDPQRINCFAISTHFMEVLGVTVFQGRTFMADEGQAGKNDVVLLDYGLWQHRFGGDIELIGKTIKLDQRPMTVVGILPPNFRFHAPPRYPDVDAFIPLIEQTAQQVPRDSGGYNVLGRMKPDVTLTQAESDLQRIATLLGQEFLEFKDYGLVPRSLDEQLFGQVKPALMIVFGTVACVLLVACVNVGGLLLVWLIRRRPEICLRLSLGASRIRILRQFVTESLLLTILGASFGLLLAYSTVHAFAGLIPRYTPVGGVIGINAHVLLFTLGTSLIMGLTFGVVLGLPRFSSNLHQGMGEAYSRSTSSLRSRHLQSWLIISQISLAFLLLISAGLMVRTFMGLMAVDPGFNPQNILATSIQLPRSKANQAGRFFTDLVRRVNQLPGVQGAAVVSSLPMRGPHSGTYFSIAGQPLEPGTQLIEWIQIISPEYFQVMQTPLLQGRLFTNLDQADSPGVVIINSTMARKYWPEENHLGDHIQAYGNKWEIVGVVKDIRKFSLLGELDPVQPLIYFSHTQNPRRDMRLVLRSASTPAGLISAIRREVSHLDPDQPMSELIAMQQILTESIWSRRTMAFLMSTFGILAFVIAIAGLYGLVAYSVAQRTNEIGIRMALGAQQTNIFASVLRDGLKPVLIGIFIGLAGAPVATRLIANKLYGVSSLDMATFIEVGVAMIIVTIVACCIPAWKATRVDPMVALRYE